MAEEETGPSADAEVPSEDESVAETEHPAAEAEDTSADAEVPSETPSEAEAPAADAPVAEAESAGEEPSAAAESATDEPSESGASAPAEAPSSRKKKKRLPRAERPQRTRPKREKPKERKPTTRLPKPEHARGRRQERQGTVVTAAADKTIVVRVDVVKVHPMYKKVIRRSTKLHAHDESNQAKVGDIVRIVETRPLSRMKRWRLQDIVEAAK